MGVPVEFEERSQRVKNPVTDMMGFGTYNMPPGTWSDDSALTFCLAESIANGFNLQGLAGNFTSWLYQSYWTATGVVFDVGIATREAINRLLEGCRADLAGGFDESSNGNGSLMRILPLVLYVKDMPIESRYEITKQVSSLTHGHIRSVIACFYYLEFARQLIQGTDKLTIYHNLKREISDFLTLRSINPEEVSLFNRLLLDNIFQIETKKIHSTGYVLHTLEASIWCLLTTDTYKEAVLKAVNLGLDTDTTGAVTGGLAGLLYGADQIPVNWVKDIKRLPDILDLAQRMRNALT
ncbi:ADP-ribosylglycohydrolase family protein [Mucilaginibacter sp. HC2]|nr:ADP-ribosylglycohydrolase family protein [Mucilaginibacter inviolabilis]